MRSELERDRLRKPETDRLAQRIDSNWRDAFITLLETGEVEDGFLDYVDQNDDARVALNEALAIEEARLQGLVGLRQPSTRQNPGDFGTFEPPLGERLMNAISTGQIVRELVRRARRKLGAGERDRVESL